MKKDQESKRSLASASVSSKDIVESAAAKAIEESTENAVETEGTPLDINSLKAVLEEQAQEIEQVFPSSPLKNGPENPLMSVETKEQIGTTKRPRMTAVLVGHTDNFTTKEILENMGKNISLVVAAEGDPDDIEQLNQLACLGKLSTGVSISLSKQYVGASQRMYSLIVIVGECNLEEKRMAAFKKNLAAELSKPNYTVVPAEIEKLAFAGMEVEFFVKSIDEKYTKILESKYRFRVYPNFKLPLKSVLLTKSKANKRVNANA